MVNATFGPWDYVVLGIMLVISASIGVYFRFSGGRQKTTDEYLMGDKNMSIIPVSFSLMAGFISAVTLLGVSTENYNYGTMFMTINVGYGIATPIVAYIYLPVFFRLQNTSVYKYLEQRFGPPTRLIASLAYSAHLVLYMGIVLYAPALALEAVTGLNKVAAILVVGTVCTFYSTIGGMKAVLFADVFQSLLMFVAIYLVVIKGTIDAGGPAEVWRVAFEGNRIEFDNVDPDPLMRHSWWSLIWGGCFLQLTLYAVNQVQVQRLLTVKTLRNSQKACWLSWPLLSVLSLSTSYSGLVLYHRYVGCDPVTSRRISSTDQLMPLYVMDSLSSIACLAGLFTSGIFSGSLSTVSSALNSLAAITLEDYLKPLYQVIKGKPVPEDHLGVIVKVIALGFGAVCIAMAFIAEFLGGILQASYTIFGVVGGPLLGIFSLGMFTTFANQKGAISGLLIGIGTMIWIGFGGPRPPIKKLPMSIDECDFNVTNPNYPDNNTEGYFWVYGVSYMWYSIIGSFLAFIVGCVVSVISMHFDKEPRESVDPDLFTPLLRSYVLRQRRKNSSSSTKLDSWGKNKKSQTAIDRSLSDGKETYSYTNSLADSITDEHLH